MIMTMISRFEDTYKIKINFSFCHQNQVLNQVFQLYTIFIENELY